MASLWSAVGVVVAAALAAWATVRVARRSASGRIDSSTARSLWDESRAIRLELRAENQEIRRHMEAAAAERERLEAEIGGLRDDLRRLKVDYRQCREDVANLVAELRGEENRP